MKNSIKIQRYIAFGIIGSIFLGMFVAMGWTMYLQIGVKMGWLGYLVPFIPIAVLALIIWCAYAIVREDA